MGKTVVIFFLLIVSLVAIQYALCPIFTFPPPEPFSGKYWYNPYADLSPNWYKANFHAHTISWLGFTDAKDTQEELIEHYKKLGYDLIGISNYMRITPLDTTELIDFRVYEHGYNIKKRHHLALNTEKVDWRDYVLWQNLNHKQHMINIMKRSSEVLAIAHPRYYHGFSQKDMKYLTGYDFVEVLNHYKKSIPIWDAALSSGRVGWILGDDDTHNTKKSKSTGVCWTMINSPLKSKTAILAAMKAGHTIGVTGKHGFMDNQLQRFTVNTTHLTIQFREPVNKIIFIGQKGEIRDERENTDSASLKLLPSDTYIRTVAHTDSCTLYFNPIFRFNGESIPHPQAEVDWLKTWLQRMVILFLFGFLLVVYIKKIRRKK